MLWLCQWYLETPSSAATSESWSWVTKRLCLTTLGWLENTPGHDLKNPLEKHIFLCWTWWFSNALGNVWWQNWGENWFCINFQVFFVFDYHQFDGRKLHCQSCFDFRIGSMTLPLTCVVYTGLLFCEKVIKKQPNMALLLKSWPFVPGIWVSCTSGTIFNIYDDCYLLKHHWLFVAIFVLGIFGTST